MKKLTLLLILVACLTTIASAQDTITTKSGLQIGCTILKQDSTNVYFIFEKDGEKIETFLSLEQISSCEYNSKKSNKDSLEYSFDDYEDVLYEKNKFNKKSNYYSDARSALTIGLLQGGGGLFGADIEGMFLKKMGVQVGIGLESFGAGINYHFRPNIKSAYFSLQYWNQRNYASYIGPTFVFRGKRWITGQVGLGYILTRGHLFPTENMYKEISTVMLYSIGAYFPIH